MSSWLFAGKYNWDAVNGLDRIVGWCRAHGIKIIISFLDNWSPVDSKYGVRPCVQLVTLLFYPCFCRVADSRFESAALDQTAQLPSMQRQVRCVHCLLSWQLDTDWLRMILLRQQVTAGCESICTR